MSELEGGSGSEATLTPHVPARADGVVMIGEMAGSGYRVPPALVRRADGQMIQLTPLLYLVLESVDGRRTHAEIADIVSERFGRLVSADNVASLVDEKLRPLGVVRRSDGAEPELKKSNPLLALRFKYAVTDPEKTRRLTAPFAVLFNPVVVGLLVVAFGVICWWLLFEKGLASATHEAFHKPGLLLLIFAVTVLSAGFHEFGHAAAARYGGSTPGTMGMGLYLLWPAFYTDVTDSYRLGRAGRIRTDLGGLYFNAIVAVGIVGIWWASGYDALLLVVATQILQMIRQLMPTVRFDGYHVLADLTGVPDLYHRIKPTLLGLLPWRWRDPSVQALKPWARGVVTLWCVTVVPLLVFSMAMMVIALPRVIATAWVSLQEQWASLTASWSDGALVMVMARMLAIIALAFPILGMGYLLWRLVRSLVVSVWSKTSGRPLQRGVALMTAMALAAVLGWVWWPSGDTYRPIAAYERGTLTDVLSLSSSSQPPVGLYEGQQSRLTTMWPDGAGRPTREHPGLAMVMVPRADQAGSTGTVAPEASSTATTPVDPTTSPTSTEPSGGDAAPSWVFPFDQPLPPEPGDNQTLAVNTTDNTVVYDVAFALVWVDGDEPVTNTNEAYAFASCTNCAAVAVSFQVVLVVGDADVVVPQNLAGALNYNCIQCLTYALATQLVVTLNGPLSDDGMTALNDVWSQIAQFATHITDYPLDELQDRLTAYEQQILAIIEADRAVTLPTTAADGSTPATTSDSTDAAATTDSGSTTPTETSTGPTSTEQSTESTTSSTTDGSTTSTTSSTTADPTTSTSPATTTATTAP